jgi:hypothetical protein
MRTLKMKNLMISGTSREFRGSKSAENIPIAFKKVLTDGGFDFLSDSKPTHLINFNHNPRAFRKFLRSGGNSSKAVLIRLEPDVVFPSQYKKRIEKLYDLILDPGQVLKSSSDEFIGWPYSYHLNPGSPKKEDPDLGQMILDSNFARNFDFASWKQRPIEVCMVLSNKVTPIGQSNYDIRREFAKKSSSAILKVFGSHWNENLLDQLRYRTKVALIALKQGYFPNLVSVFTHLNSYYPCAIGEVENKHEILKLSKYSLVIENSNSTITEKLFDSLINGCIPVYFGPDLSVIPNFSCMVYNLNLGNSKDLENLRNVGDMQISSRLKHNKEFFEGHYFQATWTHDAVFEKIATKIIQFYETGSQ